MVCLKGSIWGRMSIGKTAPVLILMILFMATACKSLSKNAQKDESASPKVVPKTEIYTTVDVKRENLEKNKMFRGTFISLKQESVAFRDEGGYLKKIYVKVGDVVKAGTLLAEVDADSLINKVKVQELQIQMAKLDFENMKLNNKSSQYDIEELSLKVEKLEAELENLEEQLSNTKLYAPIDGEIVFTDNIQIGDRVTPNNIFIQIASTDPSQFLFKCKGDFSKSLVPGQKVTVIIRDNDAFFKPVIGNPNNVNEEAYGIGKDRIKDGIVVMCPNLLPPKESKDLKDTVYIRVKDLPKDFSIEEEAALKYVYAKRSNVLVIRKGLVDSVNKNNYVYVLKNEVKVKTAVELGLQVGINVEIVKGLSEGDKVITTEVSF